ncbi:MAG: hypothetical protein QM778_28340 [Myxococcales bacterium]
MSTKKRTAKLGDCGLRLLSLGLACAPSIAMAQKAPLEITPMVVEVDREEVTDAAPVLPATDAKEPAEQDDFKAMPSAAARADAAPVAAGPTAAPGANAGADAAGFDPVGFAPLSDSEGDAPPASARETSRWSSALKLYARYGAWTHGRPALATGVQGALAEVRFRDSVRKARFGIDVLGGFQLDVAPRLDPQVTEATRDAYNRQLLLNQAHASVSYLGFELTLGRLVEVWGQGEVLGFLDLVNARDNRYPGMLDMASRRFGATAGKLGFSAKSQRVDLIVTAENRFNWGPPPLDRRNPMRRLVLDDPLLSAALADRDVYFTDQPREGLRTPEAFGRWSYTGHAMDVALHAGSLLDRGGVISAPDVASTAKRIALPALHPRYEFMGLSGVLTLARALLRWEVLYEHQRARNTRLLDAPVLTLGTQRASGLSGLLGVTYLRGSKLTLSLEVAGQTILDPRLLRAGGTEVLLAPAYQLQGGALLSMRPTQDLSLELSMVALGVPLNRNLVRDASAAVRATVQQRLTDHTYAELGLVVFESGEAFTSFYGLDLASQVWLTLRWELAR